MKKISGCLISLFCLLGIFGCAYGISPAEISMNNIMQYTPDMKPGDVPMIVRPGVSGPSGVKGTNLATSAQMNSVTQAVDVLNANRLIVNLAGHFTNAIFTTKPAKYNEHYDYAFTNGGYTHQIYFASAGLWKLTINPDLHVYTNLSTSYNVPETGWLDESGSAVGVVITNRLGAVYAEEQTRILNDGSIQEDMGFMMTTLFGKALPINTYSNYVYRVSGSDITDLNGDYYYGSSGGNFYWEKVGALNIYRLQRVLDVLTEKRKYTLLEVNSPYKVYYKNTNTINTTTFKMPPPITSWETNETATTAISVDLLYLSPIEAQARIAADNTKVGTNILTTYTVADAIARKAIASPFLGMRVVQTDENVAGYPTVLYILNAANPSLDASWLPTVLLNPETGVGQWVDCPWMETGSAAGNNSPVEIGAILHMWRFSASATFNIFTIPDRATSVRLVGYIATNAVTNAATAYSGVRLDFIVSYIGTNNYYTSDSMSTYLYPTNQNALGTGWFYLTNTFNSGAMSATKRQVLLQHVGTNSMPSHITNAPIFWIERVQALVE
jgi:hypothetical protein